APFPAPDPVSPLVSQRPGAVSRFYVPSGVSVLSVLGGLDLRCSRIRYGSPRGLYASRSDDEKRPAEASARRRAGGTGRVRAPNPSQARWPAHQHVHLSGFGAVHYIVGRNCSTLPRHWWLPH